MGRDKKTESMINPNVRKHVGAPTLTGFENWGKYSMGILVEIGYGLTYVTIILAMSYLAFFIMQLKG